MIEPIALANRLLVACDFDGTLAPIAAHPDDAAALPASEAALLRLAKLPETWVAIVSGRQRRELVDRFGVGDILLVGEHGADWGGPPPDPAPPLERARERVQEAAAATVGSLVEHKDRSVTFHYRRAHHPERAVQDLRNWAATEPELRIMEGKAILEMSVATADKGDAVVALRRNLEAEVVVFLGDDVTDESVFTRLQPSDLGVRVGPGPSAAGARLDSPEDVAGFLAQIADIRERR
jgi:trehalose 6-phosphate phosphatase